MSVPESLYIYPDKGALDRIPEIGLALREHGKMLAGGGLLYEFQNSVMRRQWGELLRKKGVLCTITPVKARRATAWRKFLDGRGDPSAFRIAPLVLGPFWHLAHGMRTKFFVLAGVYFALQTARSFAAFVTGVYLPSGDLLTLNLDLGGVVLRPQWTLIESMILGLYCGFYAEHDYFLSVVRGERLWPNLPYLRLKWAVWPAIAAVLAGWVLLRGTVVDGSIERPLIRAMLDGP